MTNGALDQLAPFQPATFFQMQGTIGKKPTLLPDTSAFLNETPFAKVYMHYNAKGIGVQVQVQRPLVHTEFPNISRGDSLELFFDTRDIKQSRHVTRFCHHFYFLPEKRGEHVEHPYGEITRFSSDDKHDLADPSLLTCKTKRGKNHYEMDLFIAAPALVGFDPTLFKKLGFTYKINQFGGAPQHFALSSEEYAIEKQPGLWASLMLL